MYIREKTEVNPVERKVCTSVWQSELIYCALDVISPELYFLKKSAGRERILAMVAA